MIRQDYKPRNNSKAFSNNAFAALPAWTTHPFAVISYALLTLILSIVLFKDGEVATEDSMIESSIDLVVEEAESVKAREFESGSISLELSEAGSLSDTRNQANKGTLSTTAKQTLNGKSTLKEQLTIKESLIKEKLNQSTAQSTASNDTDKKTKYTSPTVIPLEFNQPKNQKYKVMPLMSTSKWQSEAIKKNDNLSLIFKRIGLTPQMVYKISTLDKNTKILTNLRPGKSIYYQLGKNKELLALKYVIDLQNTLYVERWNADSGINEDNKLVSRMVNKTIEYRTAYVTGTIDDSLYLSGKRAGLTDTLVVNLANIFEFDIDFILDIRQGDTFSVLYEEKFLDGEKIGDGNILTAEFVNQGDTYKAVRYEDSKGNSSYYTPSGLSMQKAFLRAPIKFSYISSGFKLRRFHPIQKRWKAHRGIDYRAKTGTPIRAAGDGRVTHSGYDRFNGKFVFLQHGQGIVTKYIHMSKRAVSRGKKVKQGQVIGYVGSTGMSEAPHLHYEFLVNGVHRNPRTVKLPKALPISKKEKKNFLITSELLVTQLENRKQIQSSQLVAK